MVIDKAAKDVFGDVPVLRKDKNAFIIKEEKAEKQTEDDDAFKPAPQKKSSDLRLTSKQVRLNTHTNEQVDAILKDAYWRYDDKFLRYEEGNTQEVMDKN